VHQLQRWVSDHQTSLSERFALGFKEFCESSMKKQLLLNAAIKGVVLTPVLFTLQSLVDKKYVKNNNSIQFTFYYNSAILRIFKLTGLVCLVLKYGSGLLVSTEDGTIICGAALEEDRAKRSESRLGASCRWLTVIGFRKQLEQLQKCSMHTFV
jgi:hypothetical protein